MKIPSQLGLPIEEANSVMLTLICDKLGISSDEIAGSMLYYIEERAKADIMRYDNGGSEYNA